jgi:hypothetical protein
MTSRISPLAKSLKTGLISLTAATGSHCPISGTWIPQDYHSEEKTLSEGSVMPPYRGRAVLWTYAGQA